MHGGVECNMPRCHNLRYRRHGQLPLSPDAHHGTALWRFERSRRTPPPPPPPPPPAPPPAPALEDRVLQGVLTALAPPLRWRDTSRPPSAIRLLTGRAAMVVVVAAPGAPEGPAPAAAGVMVTSAKLRMVWKLT
jgi:hypothetical protein